jgi:pyruvate dehydrogenase E1 component
MGEISDGQYQKYFVESGAYFRQNFFGTDPRLLKMVEHLSDEQLARMRLGGHDPIKVYAAYKPPSSTRARRPSSWPRPSKATDWAKQAKARTSPTSRRSSTTTSCRCSARASAFPSPTTKLHDAPFYRPPTTAPNSIHAGAPQAAGRIHAGAQSARAQPWSR